MKIDLGIDIARPHPGACLYLHADVLVLRRESSCRLSSDIIRKAATALVLTSSESDAQAVDRLLRLTTLVVPQMEFGRHALESFTHEMSGGGSQETPVDAAIAWSDGTRVRLAFCGHYRFVLLRGGKAEIIPPPEGHAPSWSDVVLGIGDWFIMASPATDAAMPLGSILALARQGLDASGVCRSATAQAAQADPLNHHAVLALHLSPTT